MQTYIKIKLKKIPINLEKQMMFSEWQHSESATGHEVSFHPTMFI